MATVKGEAAARVTKMSKQDQTALEKRKVEGDLRLEVWFKPSVFAADGAWEQVSSRPMVGTDSPLALPSLVGNGRPPGSPASPRHR